MLALRTARALRPAARRFSDAGGGLSLSFAAPHTVYYFEAAVQSVTLPGVSGVYGVTAGHSPLAEQLQPGVVAITHKAGEDPEKFFVSGGFAFTDNEKTEVSALEAVKLEDIDEAKQQGKRKLAKWLRRVRRHTTSLHWACEDRDREGLLRLLRSDEYEGALPSLARLEKICAKHKHAPPVCERSQRLLRLAYGPWDVLRRHVWPRSFREHIAAVTDVTRGRGDDAICFTILSFCGRGWWAGHGPVEEAPPPVPAATVLRRRICGECQRCPMRRAGLKRCAGCRAV